MATFGDFCARGQRILAALDRLPPGSYVMFPQTPTATDPRSAVGSSVETVRTFPILNLSCAQDQGRSVPPEVAQVLYRDLGRIERAVAEALRGPSAYGSRVGWVADAGIGLVGVLLGLGAVYLWRRR